MKRALETDAEVHEPENSERETEQFELVIPSDVPRGPTMDVEDAKQDVSNFPSSREFEFGEHKVQMSAEKANLVEPASSQVSDAFCHQGGEISESELRSIASMQVERQFGKLRDMLLRRAEFQSDLEFVVELQRTDKVTRKLTDAVQFEKAMLLDGARGPWTAHGHCALGALQTA